MGLVDLFDVLRDVLFIAVLAFYLAMTAGRLDRLHIAVDASRASLELQLALRAEAIADVLAEGDIDPVSQGLLIRALARRRAVDGWNADAESDLSALIRELVDAHDGVIGPPEVQEDLRSACNRAEFAYRFHNDAVEQTLQMRMRPIVRYLHLAGHTPMPSRVRADMVPPELA